MHHSSDSVVGGEWQEGSGRREASRLRTRRKLCRAQELHERSRLKHGEQVVGGANRREGRNPEDGTYRVRQPRDASREASAGCGASGLRPLERAAGAENLMRGAAWHANHQTRPPGNGHTLKEAQLRGWNRRVSTKTPPAERALGRPRGTAPPLDGAASALSARRDHRTNQVIPGSRRTSRESATP